LEKCGFEKDADYGEFLQHPHLKCRWVFKNILGEITGVPFLRFDSTCRPPVTCTDVYFLHQLQNLYFALTGTEIDVEL
jgi:hypothetical protein